MPPTPPSTDWSYTVSVRALCEFTAKQGDLDRRFTPSATALEGQQGQATVATRRGQDYQTEVPLNTQVGPLRVRGRADGYDPRRQTLEEIKTIRGRPEDIPDNRRRLHWAQLETYGALYCRQHGLDQLSLALVYFDVASQTEADLRQVFSAAELDALLLRRCDQFIGWAQQEAAHRMARDAALQTLPFPQPAYRPGQRGLAEAVYRTVVRRGVLLAQAPTGIGKTIGTLFPLLRAMPGQGIDQLAYLTCKGTGRITALDALGSLRAGSKGVGPPLRVLTLVAKDQACEHPDKACHGDACPLARGFYDRLPAARAAAVEQAWLDPAALRSTALAHGICPYYLGQDLVRWADVLVGDVNHLFDHHGLLWVLLQAQEGQLAVLVDEAHNLVERARQMYSAELPLATVQAAAASAPPLLRRPLSTLIQVLNNLKEEVLETPGMQHAVLTRAPAPLVDALQTAVGALAEHFHQQPLATGALLDFHFTLQAFWRLVDALGAHSLLDLQVGQGGLVPPNGSAVLAVRNIVPAGFLRPRWLALHSATLFSATLAPAQYAIDLLGLPEQTAWLDVPPPFAPEHLVVQVADGLSTRFQHRAASLNRLVAVLAQQMDAHPGNYLAFFSSFDYLDRAADALARQRPDIPQWRQDRRMPADARQAFLARFAPQGQGIAFAVLGGVFAEGVDLPGTRLIGAFIATLGLPPVSPLQDHIQARLDQLFGTGHGYADLVPAMQKVVQAAGRVLRTPDDRGWLWLLDQRYRRPEVRALLPGWWQMG